MDPDSLINKSRKFITRQLRACRPAAVTLLMCAASAVFLSAQDLPSNPDQSWTTTSETVTSNASAFRTTERHTQSGNRTVDEKVVEVPGPDRSYQLFVHFQVETVQESAALTRSITRTYNRDADGRERLSQITEAETHKSESGSRTVQTTSKPDWDGRVNVVEREITETTKRPDSQNTQTTIYLPSITGGLAPTMQVNEQQRRSQRGDVAVKTETLLADGNGRWGIYEIRERTETNDANNRTIDDHVSRRDYRGNISPVSEVITKSRNNNGQLTSTTQAYSIDVPGSARDQSLHPRESSTTIRRTEPGQITTEQHLVKHDADEKRVNTLVDTKDVAIQTDSGTEERIIVTAQYPDGYPSIVSVVTRSQVKDK